MEIKIEKFTPDDFPYYFQLVNNEKVMKMITGKAIKSEEAKNNFEKLIENNNLEPNYGSFKILNIETNEFLGLAKLEIKKNNRKEAELGYMLLPEHWGKGIASKVSKQLIEIGKSQASLKRIFAIIDPNNLPSRKILTNNGFTSKEFKNFDGLPGEILELKF
ncbi:MAG TPA: GNAT family N-acetyltransferase [Bacteroidales bacterium]|nr:GNAT family N-acetyltransferase [Bacteroidales bacterium]